LRGIAPATEGNGAATMVEETLTHCAVLTPHPVLAQRRRPARIAQCKRPPGFMPAAFTDELPGAPVPLIEM